MSARFARGDEGKGVAAGGIERVTACSWWGIGFRVIEGPPRQVLWGGAREKKAGRNLASNGFGYSNLRKGCLRHPEPFFAV
jgi:hypothetical protein